MRLIADNRKTVFNNCEKIFAIAPEFGKCPFA